MCCCSPKCSSKAGLAFSILFGIFGLVALIFACIDFKLIEYDWASVGDWDSLGVLLLVAVIITILMMVFGIIFFTCCQGKRGCGITFIILQMIVTLFATAIGAMGIISSQAGKLKDYAACNTEYKGILKMYTNIDFLLEMIDTTLCSSECPCNFDAKTTKAFTENTTTKPYFEKWTKNGQNDRFQNCSETIRNNTQTKFIVYDAAKGSYLSKFKINQFLTFWKYIEKKFNCSGWCLGEYTMTESGGTTKNGAFYKFLASGVNRGIPKKLGCLKPVFDWLPPKLLVYGILAVLCGVCGIFSFYFGLLIISMPPIPTKDPNKTTENNNVGEPVAVYSQKK